MDVDEAILRDVEAAKQGDAKAYARLVERHQRLVASITLAITADVAASEDAAQEAFLEGWRDIAKLESLASFGPWICQIARNRARDLVRARKPVDDGALEGIPDAEPGALDGLLGAERDVLVAKAVQALPEDSREVMILFYREGQSIADVAKALEVSEDVVKKRLSRARERVRGKVEAAFGAALIATIPGADFWEEVFDGISSGAESAATAASAANAASAAWGPAKAFGLMAKAAVTAAVGVAAVVATQSPAVRQMVGPTTVAVAKPPAVRGSIAPAKGVSGTVTIACPSETRTLPVTKGAFSSENLPVETCRVSFDLEGLDAEVPARDITFRMGEIAVLAVKPATEE